MERQVLEDGGGFAEAVDHCHAKEGTPNKQQGMAERRKVRDAGHHLYPRGRGAEQARGKERVLDEVKHRP